MAGASLAAVVLVLGVPAASDAGHRGTPSPASGPRGAVGHLGGPEGRGAARGPVEAAEVATRRVAAEAGLAALVVRPSFAIETVPGASGAAAAPVAAATAVAETATEVVAAVAVDPLLQWPTPATAHSPRPMLGYE